MILQRRHDLHALLQQCAHRLLYAGPESEKLGVHAQQVTAQQTQCESDIGAAALMGNGKDRLTSCAQLAAVSHARERQMSARGRENGVAGLLLARR